MGISLLQNILRIVTFRLKNQEGIKIGIPKLEFKEATILAIAGTCFAIEGSIYNIFWVRMVGYIIATPGLVSMGKRLYERIQVKAKERVKERKKA